MGSVTEKDGALAGAAGRLADLAGRLAETAAEVHAIVEELRKWVGEPAEEAVEEAFDWEALVSPEAVETGGEDTPLMNFNGIDFETGAPALPAASAHLFAVAILQGERPAPEDRRQLEELAKKRWLHERDHLGPVEGVDATDLAQAGWGVIFPENADPEVRRRLGKLLEHRRNQAGAVAEGRFREITYRRGESKWDFLTRFDSGPGPVNPDEVPYYLLIAAAPSEVPYSFEHTLGVEHAVGRVSFDRPEDYETYAEAVVAAETAPGRGRRATFFGARNPGDESMAQSADHLVAPLAAWTREQGWEVRELLAEEATHANLKAELAPGRTPALLFCAAHGMALRCGHARQEELQGALLCQDWPGAARAKGELREEYYFAGDHVDESLDVRGLVAFLFACHGCGTPRYDAFSQRGRGPRQLARRAFAARLPKRWLRAGSLAVIGHVGQAWGWSYVWPGTESAQLEVFESTLARLYAGHPVGWAMEYVKRRYGELAVEMSELRQNLRGGYVPGDKELVSTWTALNDARAYTVVGDPAVRLPVSEGG